jgi:hypothetical protein
VGSPHAIAHTATLAQIRAEMAAKP